MKLSDRHNQLFDNLVEAECELAVFRYFLGKVGCTKMFFHFLCSTWKSNRTETLMKSEETHEELLHKGDHTYHQGPN